MCTCRGLCGGPCVHVRTTVLGNQYSTYIRVVRAEPVSALLPYHYRVLSFSCRPTTDQDSGHRPTAVAVTRVQFPSLAALLVHLISQPDTRNSDRELRGHLVHRESVSWHSVSHFCDFLSHFTSRTKILSSRVKVDHRRGSVPRPTLEGDIHSNFRFKNSSRTKRSSPLSSSTRVKFLNFRFKNSFQTKHSSPFLRPRG